MKTLYAEGNYINVNGELFPKTCSFSENAVSFIISRADNPQVIHVVLFSELLANGWENDLAVLWTEATLRAFLLANTGASDLLQVEVELTAQNLWDLLLDDGFEVIPAEAGVYPQIIGGSVENIYGTIPFQVEIGEKPYFVLTNESAPLRMYGACTAAICVDSQDGVAWMIPTGNSNDLVFDGAESLAGGLLESNAIGEAVKLRLWDGAGDVAIAFADTFGDGAVKLKLQYKKHIFG